MALTKAFGGPIDAMASRVHAERAPERARRTSELRFRDRDQIADALNRLSALRPPHQGVATVNRQDDTVAAVDRARECDAVHFGRGRKRRLAAARQHVHQKRKYGVHDCSFASLN
ncbi:hypothetical protein [Burkholderia sp. Tr-862]|uniref:hypothetical protein n=1 Tax=Burkholderia sp. Tr-862 TaxID=2608331 RepID=UPI001419401C|nr:hypothetical protein [Burkholderia sp. Tr-862]